LSSVIIPFLPKNQKISRKVLILTAVSYGCGTFFGEKRAENERKNSAYRRALKPKTDETRKQNKNYKLCFPVSTMHL